MCFKKLISIAVMSAVILCWSSAFATDDIVPIMDNPVAEAEKLPTTVSYSGNVSEVLTEDANLSAIVITEDGQNSDRRFNISEDTVVIDNELAVAQNITSIKKGDKITVYASPISTFSLPPQSSAYVILTNIQEKAPAKLLKVEEIAKNQDGSMTITDTDNEYMVGITKDTVLLPYRTKQIVTMDSIEKEDYILVWSEIMTMSIPAHMTADSVVLLKGFKFGEPIEDEDVTSSEVSQVDKVLLSKQAGVIFVNGKEISVKGANKVFYENKNGVCMLPLRAISEALDYSVQWTSEGKRVDILKGAKSFTLHIGSKECGKQKMRCILENEPEIKNGLTFVPIEFLTEVMEIETIINNSDN
ncbi:copper amine oxidase N-terminal domain-containing protein [Acetivibrio cellulolyticus]|uniref:copper amine oxidase N-terminal domain-containing protein n=1 Tax=Acetivibrio cellulolyticus TaxID=35830 RepID=UPI0001E2F0E0|nr:copper amine oxidase N-terminal domain-containing protein [Acetivibrio cellulolyticus]